MEVEKRLYLRPCKGFKTLFSGSINSFLFPTFHRSSQRYLGAVVFLKDFQIPPADLARVLAHSFFYFTFFLQACAIFLVFDHDS